MFQKEEPGPAERLCSDLCGTERQKVSCQLRVPYRESELGRLDLPRALGAGTACSGGKHSHHLKEN